MTFEVKGSQFYRDGKPIKIISGAVHYFRNMPDTWTDIFKKMKALGCNCVETYCAWNMHEKKQGEFDFSGNLNISDFIKKAGEEGLMVIVRPGPYICAEWDFGGLPWWIQTNEEIEIRCFNSSYIKCFSNYLENLFNEVRPHLCTNGGPVIMMQCENEYGSYGDDKEYLAYLRDFYRKQGIDVPLFTSDGPYKEWLVDGTIDGCIPMLNFGSSVQEKFRAHDEIFPDVPKMCMEMWCGWFDAWGDEKHHITDAEKYAETVDAMLKKGSLNMYMFIGGTNFGFTSGANHSEKFTPDVTSYDYDALLTECGDVTKKYYAVRDVVKKYVEGDLPQVPQNRPKKAYGRVALTEKAGLFDNLERLSQPIHSEVPKCMESYGQGYGYIAYQTILNCDYEDAILEFESLGDRAQIYINKKLVGIVYINDEELKTKFTAKAGDVLTILCENMGRTNYGPKMNRKKGIVGRCMLNRKIHFNWDVYTLPMENLDQVLYSGVMPEEESVFYRGKFEVDNPCDTFLNTENFTKGFVMINGFNLGRYWDIGPQKTLYVPASILKQGENEIVLFESDGIKGEPEVLFVDKPDLGEV